MDNESLERARERAVEKVTKNLGSWQRQSWLNGMRIGMGALIAEIQAEFEKDR